MMVVVVLLLGLLLVLGVLYVGLYRQVSTHLPSTFPVLGKLPPLDSARPVVVCLGDSNTHGNVSYNWVAGLQQRHPAYQFVNAGRNSDLTYTLLRRLEAVLACQPDYVTLLVGTNDLNATMSQALLKRYRRIGRIGEQEHPSLSTFCANFRQIVQTLRERTQARIAVMSLPLVGEDLSHEANIKADAYSQCIRQIAEAEGLTYLPIREQQKAYLAVHPSRPKYTFEQTYQLLIVSAMLHYVLGWGWNRIAAYHGFCLTTDNLHQSQTAGTMIADLVEGFVVVET